MYRQIEILDDLESLLKMSNKECFELSEEWVKESLKVKEVLDENIRLTTETMDNYVKANKHNHTEEYHKRIADFNDELFSYISDIFNKNPILRLHSETVSVNSFEVKIPTYINTLYELRTHLIFDTILSKIYNLVNGKLNDILELSDEDVQIVDKSFSVGIKLFEQFLLMQIQEVLDHLNASISDIYKGTLNHALNDSISDIYKSILNQPLNDLTKKTEKLHSVLENADIYTKKLEKIYPTSKIVNTTIVINKMPYSIPPTVKTFMELKEYLVNNIR